MAQKQRLYQLTKGDKEVFQVAKEEKNPNYITDYYLRSPDSGTWWLPGAKSDKWSKGYALLTKLWKHENSPNIFKHKGIDYRVRFDHSKQEEFPDFPAFFHNHGYMFLPYHLQLYNDRHFIRTVIGGFGSGKTMGASGTMSVRGITLTQYRAFALGPQRKQAEEFYDIIVNMMSGTLFEERFLISHALNPYPKIVFGHDGVGANRIECYSIAEDPQKIRTMTGDEAYIDQAEHPDLDIAEVQRSIGTRFRGRVSRDNRERVGTLTFLANAGDKQELWDLFDRAEDDPDHYLSLMPSSYDNPYLTDTDLERFEVNVGGTQEDQEVWLKSRRPMGNGMHFSRATLDAMTDKSLDEYMERGLVKQVATGEDYGFVKMEGRNVGCFEFLLPYNSYKQYLVISDPGTKNPPQRDSPVIMVWDITDFPGEGANRKPARMVGFVWVFGNNNINSWATRFAEIVNRYHAIGYCGFDATGYQSGYDQWMSIINNLFAEKINLAGNGKALCLNAAKMLTSRNMMLAPACIAHLYNQLARYEYPPEPKHVRQDIVMAFIMSAWWLQRLFYYNTEEFKPRPNFDPNDRYGADVIEDRYDAYSHYDQSNDYGYVGDDELARIRRLAGS